MNDLISRQAAIDALVKHSYLIRYDFGFTSIENGMTITGIKQALSELPSAERRGRWIDGKCNRCGTHAPYWAMASTYYLSEYCPNCGAKMDEEASG